MNQAVLVGDIGGTNARFALARRRAEGGLALEEVAAFRVAQYGSFDDAARAYLSGVKTAFSAACIAVAAPIGADEIALTNAHWRINSKAVKRVFGVKRLRILNDFHALAAGVEHMSPAAFVSVHDAPGDATAPIIVLGPGTGFGQALIVPASRRRIVIATQGGHVAFAPHDAREAQVLEIMRRRFPRVSVERILSGPGLVNLHESLGALARRQGSSLTAAEITERGSSLRRGPEFEALSLFCAILGGAAGDAVLATGALGGVVLAGGILPRISDFLISSPFKERFMDKGVMRSYVAAAPVRLLVEDGAALKGAAAVFFGAGASIRRKKREGE